MSAYARNKHKQKVRLCIGDLVNIDIGTDTDTDSGMVVWIGGAGMVCVLVQNEGMMQVEGFRGSALRIREDSSLTPIQQQVQMYLAECKEPLTHELVRSYLATLEGFVDSPLPPPATPKEGRVRCPPPATIHAYGNCAFGCERILIQPGYRVRFGSREGVVLSVREDTSVEVRDKQTGEVMCLPSGKDKLEVCGNEDEHELFLCYGNKDGAKTRLRMGMHLRCLQQDVEGELVLILPGGHIRVRDKQGMVHRIRSGFSNIRVC